jgi:hypothetical protein
MHLQGTLEFQNDTWPIRGIYYNTSGRWTDVFGPQHAAWRPERDDTARV